MITLERLTIFSHENLGYKNNVKVISYDITGNWISLNFDSVMGEVVSDERFYNWMNENREEKLSKILK
jgi:hypothetical protein